MALGSTSCAPRSRRQHSVAPCNRDVNAPTPVSSRRTCLRLPVSSARNFLVTAVRTTSSKKTSAEVISSRLYSR